MMQEELLSVGPTRRMNPWLTMWTQPRKTMRYILTHYGEAGPWLLAMVLSYVQVLDNASLRNLGEKLPLEQILLGALITAPLGALLMLGVFAPVLRMTGGFLGGTATTRDMRLAITWGYVPMLWAGLLWAPLLALYGHDLFLPEDQAARIEANPLPLLAIGGVQLATSIWSLVTLLKCVGEAHGFSAWRALGANLMAALTILVPLMLLILLLSRLANPGG